ncbi:MAG: RNA 2',3'-cyclic phosphodiesterase [Planctomycetota bacterium]|nr:RNA 2',3'-cyclic phosphodiesterase [Planctomycetota bacterium]
MAETTRTFIALQLPPQVHAHLADCQQRLKHAGGDVRWVRPDIIHLTLVFLGDVPTEMLADLEKSAREALLPFGPIALRVQGAGRFPPRGLPRTIWIGLEETSGRLAALQKALAEATAAFAEKPEDRAYTPHLTLGRVKSPRGGRDLAGAIDAMAGVTGPTFEAREVTVFKSELSAQGPTYTALAHVPLQTKIF